MIPREEVESISLCHPPQCHRNSSERELIRREMDGISQPKNKGNRSGEPQIQLPFSLISFAAASIALTMFT